MNISTGNWQNLKEHASYIRQTVFVQEQQVPIEIEYDEHDHHNFHAVAFDDQGQPIGTARLLPNGHIGRLAVLKSWRGKGVGKQLMLTLCDEARRRGDREIIIHAQVSAETFYLPLGFKPEGAIFMEANIPHRLMRKTLA